MSYKRVLLKISGESLKLHDTSILNAERLQEIAQMINTMRQTTQVCVVIGAGNIWRGRIAESAHLDRIQADFMGMLGTVINAVAVASSLRNLGAEALVTSALPAIEGATVAYDIETADKAMNEGKVVFLGGGTGKPLFSTDTAAALRAIELGCDAILMGKNNVLGVYNADPWKNPDAKFMPRITYKEMEGLHLQVIDEAAVELLKDKNIDVRIFNMDDINNFVRVANGEHLGTILSK